MARRYFTKPSLEAWFTAVKACNPKKAKGQGFTIFLSATQLLGTISANTKSNILSLVLCVFCSEWKQAPLGPWSYGETDKPDRAEQRTFLFQGISLENNIENIIIENASSHLYCNQSIKKVLYCTNDDEMTHLVQVNGTTLAVCPQDSHSVSRPHQSLSMRTLIHWLTDEEAFQPDRPPPAVRNH